MHTLPAPGISLTVKKHRGTQRLAVLCTEERGRGAAGQDVVVRIP